MFKHKTRKVVLRKIKDKNYKLIIDKMYNFFKEEKLNIKSIIVDNGLEFQMMGILQNNLILKFIITNHIHHFKEVVMKILIVLLKDDIKKYQTFH